MGAVAIRGARRSAQSATAGRTRPRPVLTGTSCPVSGTWRRRGWRSWRAWLAVNGSVPTPAVPGWPSPGDAITHPPPRARTPVIPDCGTHRVKEVTMTRRIRLWIAAVLTAAGLMVGLAVAAHVGVRQAHPQRRPGRTRRHPGWL